MRFGIDRSHRVKHGALLDAQLLAQVYVELTGGRQIGLGLVADTKSVSVRTRPGPSRFASPGPRGRISRRKRNLRVTARLSLNWSTRCGRVSPAPVDRGLRAVLSAAPRRLRS